MNTESLDSDNQIEQDKQPEMIFNSAFTPQEAYDFAMRALYNPPEKQYYINDVISLSKECLDFLLDIQIYAIESEL